jgi:hypothetical protein
MKLIKTLAFFLLIPMFFSACKKEATPASGTTKTDILCKPTWKVEEMRVDKHIESDDYTEHERWRFSADGTYKYGYDIPASKGTWKFSDNEKSIIMDEDTNNEVSASLVTLAPTTFQYIYTSQVTGKEIYMMLEPE